MNPKTGNTILAGVDGSERSADALALAMTLGMALQATPLVAYVHPYGDLRNVLSNTQYEDAVGELTDSVHNQMRRLAMPVDERAMTVLGDRSPARGLQQIAERRAASLVVVGSSHRSRVGRVFPGGTAERLLSGAPCPVAVAPRGYAERKHALSTIGLAFDGSVESHLALAWTTVLARQSDAHVRVLSVREGVPGASALADRLPIGSVNAYLHRDLAQKLTQAERELREHGISVEGKLLDGEAVTLLEHQAAELDLLIMGSRGYGPARAVLLGSVSTALVREAASPVVVIPRDAGGTLVRAAG